MSRAGYQRAVEILSATNLDIDKARAIFDRNLKPSQALREEAWEVYREHCINMALKYSRRDAVEGRPNRILAAPVAKETVGVEDQPSSDAQTSPVPSPPSDSKSDAGDDPSWREAPCSDVAPASDPSSAEDHPPFEAHGPLVPATSPKRPMRDVIRGVGRIYSGLHGHPLFSVSGRVLGDANAEIVTTELRTVAAKQTTTQAYLYLLGALVPVLQTKGGIVADHFSPDELQRIHDNGRKAFGLRIDRYLTAGTK